MSSTNIYWVSPVFQAVLVSSEMKAKIRSDEVIAQVELTLDKETNDQQSNV